MNLFSSTVLKKAGSAFSTRRITGERCVLCGQPTGIPAELPVDRRDCYVEGAGQLCRRCWQKLYDSR